MDFMYQILIIKGWIRILCWKIRKRPDPDPQHCHPGLIRDEKLPRCIQFFASTFYLDTATWSGNETRENKNGKNFTEDQEGMKRIYFFNTCRWVKKISSWKSLEAKQLLTKGINSSQTDFAVWRRLLIVKYALVTGIVHRKRSIIENTRQDIKKNNFKRTASRDWDRLKLIPWLSRA